MEKANRKVLKQRLRSQQIVIEYMTSERKSTEGDEKENFHQFDFYFSMLLEYIFCDDG